MARKTKKPIDRLTTDGLKTQGFLLTDLSKSRPAKLMNMQLEPP
jgi:hypothetical protein